LGRSGARPIGKLGPKENQGLADKAIRMRLLTFLGLCAEKGRSSGGREPKKNRDRIRAKGGQDERKKKKGRGERGKEKRGQINMREKGFPDLAAKETGWPRRKRKERRWSQTYGFSNEGEEKWERGRKKGKKRNFQEEFHKVQALRPQTETDNGREEICIRKGGENGRRGEKRLTKTKKGERLQTSTSTVKGRFGTEYYQFKEKVKRGSRRGREKSKGEERKPNIRQSCNRERGQTHGIDNSSAGETPNK